jgi:serine/threonine-protein kinase
LYSFLSQKQFTQARSLFSPELAEQFDPDFFRQFQEVTLEDLLVTSSDNYSISFIGTNTYIWEDGSSQQEKRSYTVALIDGEPKITASQFIKVIRLRS